MSKVQIRTSTYLEKVAAVRHDYEKVGYRGFLNWIAAEPRFEFLRPMDLVDRLELAYRGQ